MFVKGCLALATLAAIPGKLLAGVWAEKAFSAETEDGAMTELFGDSRVEKSDSISLRIPDVAENGAEVPVSIETDLEGVHSIGILVEENPRPLAVHFDIPAGTLPAVMCRIKMGETSRVTAVVETPNGVLSTAKTVKVVVGGCFG